MMPTRQGSIRLFRLFGIEVFLHWSWFLAVLYVVQFRGGYYQSAGWNVLELVTLFLIVLLHEFGHSLACRQVGGQANQIVLWPLGGVAYVSPPQRPGATLWSIAAGPLVNVILAPVFTGLLILGRSTGWLLQFPDLNRFVFAIWQINIALIVFNLLPVYPLDGGQILRSLLWFPFGRARSLLIAASMGIPGVIGLIVIAILIRDMWLGILALFVLLNCWRGLLHARALARLESAPRREDLACPACRTPPPIGAFWGCGKCRKAFDPFEARGLCPHCGARYDVTFCPECGRVSPFEAWVTPPPVAAAAPPPIKPLPLSP